MRIAILSDTHDNIWALRGALPHLAASDVILHCGDLCSPFVLKLLGEGVQGRPVHVVWGNNEGDVRLMSRIALDLPHISLHGALAELDLDGLRVAVNHYPEIARGLAASGKYDLVCFGHNHRASQEQVGGCCLLNPGELMGMHGRRTVALFDTRARTHEWLELVVGNPT